MALMALSDSKVNNNKSCSKTCLRNYEALKKQYDDLLVKLSDTDFKAATYKRGLATLEGQIVKYREHEVLFSEEIALLKRSVDSKEYQMGLLRAELEKVKQEKEGFEFKIAKFEKSAKDLEQMLESQITDKSKKGVLRRIPKEPEVNESVNQIEKLVKRTVRYADKSLVKEQESQVKSSFVEGCRPVHTVRSVNSGRPFSTARSFNTVRPFYTAHPNSTIHCARPRTNFQNQAQSTVDRPFYKRTALTKMSNSQLNDKGFVDSGCSRHMTGNIAPSRPFDGGYVTFGGVSLWAGRHYWNKGTFFYDFAVCFIFWCEAPRSGAWMLKYKIKYGLQMRIIATENEKSHDE
ncbi:hypothetical protein Tco_0949261 [Tanacetum coccineum]